MGGVNGTGFFILGLEYVIITTSCLVSALGVAGNACVLLICAKLNKEAGLYAIYYASLALSDLLLSGPCLIPQIWAQCKGHYVEVDYEWIQVWGFTYITARMSSILTLSVISLERMMAVMTPHFYRRVDKSHAAVLVLLCWLLSVLVGISPYLVGECYEYYRGAAMASNNRNLANNINYYVVTEVMSLYLPTSAIIVSVCLITWRVKRMKHKTHKVTATLLTVFFAYIACFSVYFVFSLLVFSGLLYKLPPSAILYIQNFSFLILGGHSAVNPVIYAFKAAQFKDEIKHIENQALVRCLSFLLKLRKTSFKSNSGTIDIPTIHKSSPNRAFELEDFKGMTEPM